MFLHGETSGVPPAITKAVRAALNNKNIKRLEKTKQVSQYLDQFYLWMQDYAPANPNADKLRERKRSGSSITPVMQSKWLHLSLNCEAPPLLAKNKSALFAVRASKRKAAAVAVDNKKKRLK